MIEIFNTIEKNYLNGTLNKNIGQHVASVTTCGQCDEVTSTGFPKSTQAQHGMIKLYVTSTTNCNQCDKGAN